MKIDKLSSSDSIKSFIIKNIILLIVSSAIWFIIVFFYYQNETTKSYVASTQTKIEMFRDEIKSMNLDKKDRRAYAQEQMTKLFHEENVAAYLMQINNRTIQEYYKENLFTPIKANFLKRIDDIDPMKGVVVPCLLDDTTYIMFRITQEKFDMYFLIPLSAEIVKKFETTVKQILFVSIISILITYAISFPFVYRQYKRLLLKEQDLLQSNLGTINALGNAISKRDSDTDEHNYRVTYYSIKIAQLLKLNKQQIQNLIKGAFLHDVGKIGVEDSILLKPGKLTSDEFEIMKKHVNHGAEIVNGVTWLEDAKCVIEGHHEKFDGSGYPKGLQGEEIQIEARIFAIVDVFDALTSKRPYKEPFTLEKSKEIILDGSGSHFDPKIVTIFIENIENFYNIVTDKRKPELEELLSGLIRKYY